MAKVTLKNMFAFIEGNLKMTWDRMIGLPEHEKEQIAFRARVCEDCVALGECKACGCPTPDKFFSTEPCDGNTYPRMMNKEDWEKYKKENFIN